MLSLSAVARFLFREYAFGNIQIGITHKKPDNSEVFEYQLDQAIKDAKNSKNLSPSFSNANDLLSHLHTLS